MARKDTKALQARVVAETQHSRRTVDRVLDRQGLFPVRAVFESEVEKIQKQLRRALRGKLRNEVGVGERNATLQFLTKRSTDLGDKVADIVVASTKSTIAESLNEASRFLYKVRRQASVIDDPVMADRIARQYLGPMVEARATAARQVSNSLIEALVEKTRLRAGKEATVGDLIEGVEVEFERQWWRVERYVQTETARAYNAIQYQVVQEASADLKGLFSRWTERIDDFSGRPFDNRVAEDSKALHGQLARPGGVFTMPGDAKVHPRMIGATWAYPPNRPHDRAVLTPWMREWGTPGWIYQAGQRVPL